MLTAGKTQLRWAFFLFFKLLKPFYFFFFNLFLLSHANSSFGVMPPPSLAAVVPPLCRAGRCRGAFVAVFIPLCRLASQGFAVHLFLGNCSVRAPKPPVGNARPDEGGFSWRVYF